MKEVERKDLPGITGGQASTTNVTIVAPTPATPTFPGGPTINDPSDPLGEARQRPVQS